MGSSQPILFRTVKEWSGKMMQSVSVPRPAVRISILRSESGAVQIATYWSLSVRSINAEAALASRGYAHAARADIRRGWPIIISLHFLSGLQSSCLSSGCCMISTVQDQQPWHADSQNLQAPLILNDSSCITETVLFALLWPVGLKVVDEGTGLRHRCDLLDTLHIVWVWADQCNMWILLVSVMLVDMQCVSRHSTFVSPSKSHGRYYAKRLSCLTSFHLISNTN